MHPPYAWDLTGWRIAQYIIHSTHAVLYTIRMIIIMFICFISELT